MSAARLARLARRYQRVLDAEAELRVVQFCLDLGLEHPAPEFAPLAAELAVPELGEVAASPQHRRTIAALSLETMATGPFPLSQRIDKWLAAWRDDGGALQLQKLDLAWGPLRLVGAATIAMVTSALGSARKRSVVRIRRP